MSDPYPVIRPRSPVILPKAGSPSPTRRTDSNVTLPNPPVILPNPPVILPSPPVILPKAGSPLPTPTPTPESPKPLLVSLIDVVKTYPGPLTVLHDISLDIGTGDEVAVVGPSGSGKTTMLSIMGILDRPTSGEVRIGGVDTGSLPEADRAQLRAEVIGFVFQQFFLLPTLSAVENVAEGMLYQGIRRTQRKKQAMEALERVGLSARANHLPGQLSGGEQQRVAIARAIAGGPQLLFADEPTGALDQASGHMVVDQLLQIASEGTTVVVITHDTGLASRFSRQISLLDGQIVSDSAAPVIQSHPQVILPETGSPQTGQETDSPVILPKAGSPEPDEQAQPPVILPKAGSRNRARGLKRDPALGRMTTEERRMMVEERGMTTADDEGPDEQAQPPVILPQAESRDRRDPAFGRMTTEERRMMAERRRRMIVQRGMTTVNDGGDDE